MNSFLGILAGKLIIFISKLLKKQSSSKPGEVALKFDKNILSKLSRNTKTIVVCGTNGKTSTNNMILSVLKASGKNVVCNEEGANMVSGIVTAFLKKGKADFATLEIDEAYATKVFDFICPDQVVVTNLSKDQLDRYGNIENTSLLIKNALDKAPNAMLYLCADSNEVLKLGEGRPFKTFSIQGSADFKAESIAQTGNLKFTVKNDEYILNMLGKYNVCNALAAIAVCSDLKLPTSTIQKGIANFKNSSGRMEQFAFGDKKLVLNLAKNPESFNKSIDTILSDASEASILFAVNNNNSDGVDVSWLWDIDFEKLPKDIPYITSGKKAHDVALRLKYADINTDKITSFENIKSAVAEVLKTDSKVAFLIVNYTAMIPVRKALLELGAEK